MRSGERAHKTGINEVFYEMGLRLSPLTPNERRRANELRSQEMALNARATSFPPTPSPPSVAPDRHDPRRHFSAAAATALPLAEQQDRPALHCGPRALLSAADAAAAASGTSAATFVDGANFFT